MLFVRMPSSKTRDDPLHDDRVLRMLRSIWPDGAADLREIIIQTESADAAHDSPTRPTPQLIEARYRID